MTAKLGEDVEKKILETIPLGEIFKETVCCVSLTRVISLDISFR